MELQAYLDHEMAPGEPILVIALAAPDGTAHENRLPVSVIVERMELLGVDEQEAVRVMYEDEPLLTTEDGNPYEEAYQGLLRRAPAAERAAQRATARSRVERPGMRRVAGRAPFNPIVQEAVEALTPEALAVGRQRFAERIRDYTNGEVDLDG